MGLGEKPENEAKFFRFPCARVRAAIFRVSSGPRRRKVGMFFLEKFSKLDPGERKKQESSVA